MLMSRELVMEVGLEAGYLFGKVGGIVAIELFISWLGYTALRD
jgi:hypothetical protein